MIALFLMCIVVVAALQFANANKEDVAKYEAKFDAKYKSCFETCEKECLRYGSGQSYCEVKCDEDCDEKEAAGTLSSLYLSLSFDQYTRNALIFFLSILYIFVNFDSK